MDRRIYGKGYRNDYGTYVTRRYPKGGSISGELPTVAGAVPLSLNPVPIDASASADSVAPHGSTIRYSYVVPAKRMMTLKSAMMELRRLTAGAPGSDYRANVDVIRKGQTTGRGLVTIRSLDNTAPNRIADHWQGDLQLFEGDELRWTTADASTGGTIKYDVSFIGVEFDAIDRIAENRSAEFYASAEQGSGGSGNDSSQTSSAPLLGYAPDPRYPWR